jgi:hypothetical protein
LRRINPARPLRITSSARRLSLQMVKAVSDCHRNDRSFYQFRYCSAASRRLVMRNVAARLGSLPGLL